MEYLGVIAFVLVLGYSGLPNKVSKLEKGLKRIKKNVKGETSMSKLIRELKGQTCQLSCNEGLLDGKTVLECLVIDVDDEWIKISFVNKKQETNIKIIRIDTVESIELSK